MHIPQALAEAGLDMIMADRVGLIARSLKLYPVDNTRHIEKSEFACN
jgi:hypothetical protein